MRRAVLTLALLVAAGLAVLWVQGGFEALARMAAEGQRSAQNAMAGSLRALRAGEAGALAGLLGLAFAYGFFHAAGPGHGKLLIGGYGAATQVRLGALAGIALAASLGQATMAVGLVHGGIALFDWTRAQVTDLGEGVLTQASTVMIGLVGLWLAVRGVRGLVALARPAPLAAVGAGHDGHGHEGHGHEGHGHGHGGHDHRPGAVCGACGHRHGPSLEEVSRLTGWRDAALLIGAIAIRPCTGALFLLILTWRMGIAGAGILATYVMGLGTAVITVGVAVLAVLARDGALDWSGRFGALRPLFPALQLAVGGLVVLAAVQALRLGV